MINLIRVKFELKVSHAIMEEIKMVKLENLIKAQLIFPFQFSILKNKYIIYMNN